MLNIRYVKKEDALFWFQLDRHLSREEFYAKVRDLMAYWEQDMQSKGYGMVMTSTQTDEMAQHFYRKLGYREAGSLILDLSGYRQPMEMFFVKETGCLV